MASVKDPWELALMRESGRRLAEVSAALREAVRPGMTTRDLDAVADAWFARALDAAMAVRPRDAAFPDRLSRVIGAWLDTLAPHRAASLAMLRRKLYPSHPHHWVPLAFNLSRLVQWWLDAAACPSRGRRRQLEEIAVSALALSTLAEWRRGGDAATHRRVVGRLRRLERGLDRVLPRLSGS